MDTNVNQSKKVDGLESVESKHREFLEADDDIRTGLEETERGEGISLQELRKEMQETYDTAAANRSTR